MKKLNEKPVDKLLAEVLFIISHVGLLTRRAADGEGGRAEHEASAMVIKMMCQMISEQVGGNGGDDIIDYMEKMMKPEEQKALAKTCRDFLGHAVVNELIKEMMERKKPKEVVDDDPGWT